MKYDVQKIVTLAFILMVLPISVPASERGDGTLEATKPQSLDTAKQATADRWRKLLKDWKTERNRLNSGSVVIKGEDDLTISSRSDSGEQKKRRVKEVSSCKGLLIMNWDCKNGWLPII